MDVLLVIFALVGLAMAAYLIVAGGGTLLRTWLKEERYEHLNLRNSEDATGHYRVTYAVRDAKGSYMAIVKRKKSFWYRMVVRAQSREALEKKVEEAYKQLETDWLLKRW